MDVAALAATLVAMKQIETGMEMQTRMMKQQIESGRSVVDLLDAAAMGGSVTEFRGQGLNLVA